MNINLELRQHGTGYYAFSTIESERESQMNLLNKLRSTTVKEREKSESKNQQKQNIINKRLEAIKKRRNINTNNEDIKKNKISCDGDGDNIDNGDTNIDEDILNSFLKDSKSRN